VIRRQDVAEDGAIVAALLPGPGEDEATVKRLRRKGRRLSLIPEHPSMEPFDLPEDGRILGQVVAVFRKL
jgi:SOS-response transcriptional repressor LexA